jgi:transcriptional repressor NrdR
VTGPQIEALLDDIEVALHAMGGMELPSNEVGDLVMERLRELNYAAYVRFAAHYRDFLSVDDLQEEITRRRAPRTRRDAAQPPLLPPTPLEPSQAEPTRIAAGRRRTRR